MITSKNKKVLIIEDEKILGEILLKKMNSEGYTAYLEVNGKMGLEKMREIKPDIVLLDIVMPVMDGYEVLEEIKKDKELSGIPVMIISNSGQPVEIERILKLGAVDYVVKAQFSPEEVIEKMEKYFRTDNEPENKNTELLSGIKILIVEDDSFLSSIIFDRLKKEGYNVSLAADGETALKFIEREIPDLVLLDILMPGISGLEVLKKIKEDPRTKDISVIIFSNLGQEQEMEEGRKLGADDYLIKARITPKELIIKIDSLFKKKGKI